MSNVCHTLTSYVRYDQYIYKLKVGAVIFIIMQKKNKKNTPSVEDLCHDVTKM